MMQLHKDIREFIELLLSEKVEFVLVGGYALAFHGAPRFTEDIDFLLRVSEQNAERVSSVLNRFGFAGTGISRSDFLAPEQVIQLGRAPHRIDLLTSISGVPWNEAWATRQMVTLEEASGRAQDLADVARLRRGETPTEPPPEEKD